MAKIRVGVKRTDRGMEVKEVGDPGIEVFAQWVEINGMRLDTTVLAAMSIAYKIDGSGMGMVTIELASEGFETVDCREIPVAATDVSRRVAPAPRPDPPRPDPGKVERSW